MAGRIIMMLLDQPIEINDIVVAPAATWWPLAIGWYIVAIVVVVAIVGTIVWSVRAYRKTRPRRLALRQLRQHPPQTLSDVTLLLKQATLAYLPHERTLSWWEFLSAQLSARQQRRYQPLLSELSEVSYQPIADQQPWLEPYREFAEVWLKRALPPAKKQQQTQPKEQSDD
jgi:hypothetical protein